MQDSTVDDSKESAPIFLKLGGSLLTDKRDAFSLRKGTLARVAHEISSAYRTKPDLSLLVGHGSGSFGHVVAAKYGTRAGVREPDEWYGFAAVSQAAARLNAHVRDAFLEAGLPAVSLQPSASAQCLDGELIWLATKQLQWALEKRLVPIIYGDVGFDVLRGGTILSTEQLLGFLVGSLSPNWLILAGDTAGVLDPNGEPFRQITRHNFAVIAPALGGSSGTDVTGGMGAKVRSMLDVVEQYPALRIRIVDGRQPGLLERLLLDPAIDAGTEICAD
jgi:isopentenyl phosphate kinase